MNRHIENTTRAANENPSLTLLEMAFVGGIEAQERRGQAQVLASTSLPTDTGNTDAEFVALGFAFGEPDSNDPMFRPATLPGGWKREGSDHAMWSYIVDERGIQRVAIFYKAAFYDRSAHMRIRKVGDEIGCNAVYADEPPTRESLRLDVLTPDEVAGLRKSLDRMRADIADGPSIYGKYADRLAQCDAVLAEASA